MKTFLICPVRNWEQTETESIVRKLEKDGWEVYYPAHDTDQDDSIGYRICLDNRDAIKEADVVHLIWNGESQGCLFDLGMAFAFVKPVKVISMPDLTEGKSFQNVVHYWEGITSGLV